MNIIIVTGYNSSGKTDYCLEWLKQFKINKRIFIDIKDQLNKDRVKLLNESANKNIFWRNPEILLDANNKAKFLDEIIKIHKKNECKNIIIETIVSDFLDRIGEHIKLSNIGKENIRVLIFEKKNQYRICGFDEKENYLFNWPYRLFLSKPPEKIEKS